MPLTLRPPLHHRPGHPSPPTPNPPPPSVRRRLNPVFSYHLCLSRLSQHSTHTSNLLPHSSNKKSTRDVTANLPSSQRAYCISLLSLQWNSNSTKQTTSVRIISSRWFSSIPAWEYANCCCLVISVEGLNESAKTRFTCPAHMLLVQKNRQQCLLEIFLFLSPLFAIGAMGGLTVIIEWRFG